MSKLCILQLIAFISCLIIRIDGQSYQTCDQSEYMRSDQCTSDALIIEGDQIAVPRTMAQLNNGLCHRVNEKFKCMADLRKCLKPFPRQMYNLGVRNSRKVVKDICASDESKKELVFWYTVKLIDCHPINLFFRYLQKMSCFRSPEEKHLLFSIYNIAAEQMEWTLNSSRTSDLLPRLCCMITDNVHHDLVSF